MNVRSAFLAASLLALSACSTTPTASSSASGSGTSSQGGPALTMPVQAVGGSALTAESVAGVWALTDARNSTFNVRLAPDGRAVSTCSTGPTGAVGERGTWAIVDGKAVINWTNGWLDVLRAGQFGLEKWSWGPGDNRNGTPNNFGMAVQIVDGTQELLGIWQSPGVIPGDPETIYFALQSDGMAFKTIGQWRYGCWSPDGNGFARITWANGWYDELGRDRDGFYTKTWTPAADRSGPPTASHRVRRVD